MAVEIIVLERLNAPSDWTFRFAMWATVPASRVAAYANATATSAWRGASGPQIASIQAGQIAEQVAIASYPLGTTIATIGADMVTRFGVFQALVNSLNPDLYYGTTYDSVSGWTVAQTS